MRAREFIREGDIHIPGSGNTINIYVNSSEEAEEVLNPGIRYNDDGTAKWSPPLQQHLDAIKDTAGTTSDDTTIEPEQDKEPQKADDDSISLLRKLAAITATKPSVLG
jgi:hypothetical protein